MIGSEITLLWLWLAAGCLVLGALFTVRRPQRRVRRIAAPVLCPRCRETLEVDARFCGICGLSLVVNEL